MIDKIKNLAEAYKLPFAIIIAIIISLILTVVSIVLYAITGTASLDLSRPGYEVAREQVKHPVKNDTDFDSDGPINTGVMKDFLKKYEKQTLEINSYDSFNQKLLEDSQLGITSQQIAPSDGASPQ